MKTFIRCASLMFALALSASAGAQVQQASKDTAAALPAWRMRIMGVYDDRTGEPVEDADVTDVMNGNTARTSSTGTVALAFLPEGGGLVRIKKLGYEMQTMMVTISPTDSLPLTVILKKATTLAAITVVDSAPRYRSPKLQSFEERRKNAAAGQYLPESLIRKEDGRNIGEFLRANLSNAAIRDGRNGAVYMLQSARCGRGSFPAVYLDGALLSGDTQNTPPNLAEIKVEDLAGVEYYANTATAPPQYNGTAKSCGALLLWTGER
jgi:hypothetical protein